jgi:hypothetical protein
VLGLTLRVRQFRQQASRWYYGTPPEQGRPRSEHLRWARVGLLKRDLLIFSPLAVLVGVLPGDRTPVYIGLGAYAALAAWSHISLTWAIRRARRRWP